MVGKKTEIVLDADVINHFAKGGCLDMLPRILPEYQFVVLNIVKNELPIILQPMLDKLISREKTIKEVHFGDTDGEKKEYFRLTATNGLHLGKGESACMVYCKYHHNVVGSSNTKDIIQYCNDNGIVFLTTNDFLYYALRRKLLTAEQISEFVTKVNSMGSYIPEVNFETYFCNKV